ncbi:MAG TPA: cysteine desulfurase family protein [Burkholderiales bacterium]|nr:cysteine desulfurase family protein [Burkholderiales bacterium]
MTVYLDFNATTPIRGAVLDEMLPWLKSGFGNPSSSHCLGRAAREALENARSRVASAVGCKTREVVFTSGGTEANNLFIKGLASALSPSRICVSSIEHPSIAKPARSLERSGWTVHSIAVDESGRLDMRDAENAFAAGGIASVMLANNECGVVQDIGKIAEMARSGRTWMHTDAVQAFGKMPLDFHALGVDAMTISAHKIYGPKGIGALIVDRRLPIMPLVEGGGQESDLRSGTENVAAIVGFGAAAEIAVYRMTALMEGVFLLKEKLASALSEMGAVLFSGNVPALPNTLYFAFQGIDGGTLVTEMDRAGYAVASGSACSSGATEPSAALLAMGVNPDLARGAVRVSLGEGSSDEQISGFVAALKSTVSRLSRMMKRLQA